MATRAIGIDGCPAGWVAATRDGVVVDASLAGLLARLQVSAERDVVAVDMPIGLADSGRRDCDAVARERLGHARHSVFWTATRGAVYAPDAGLSLRQAHTRASAINIANDAKGVSAQAFHLFAKIREVDALLHARRDWRACVFEVHPELAFARWNQGEASALRPLRHPKKSGLGAYDRLSLIFARYGRRDVEQARGRYPKTRVADDDIADAYACLFSAERIAAGQHVSLPATPPRDATGLPMRIVY